MFKWKGELAKHRSSHIIDEYIWTLCGLISKNIYRSQKHITKIHPKEYEITKDLIDIIIKKNETVAKIST